jgi:hypothetical protein
MKLTPTEVGALFEFFGAVNQEVRLSWLSPWCLVLGVRCCIL